jgi:hypothetical protein
MPDVFVCGESTRINASGIFFSTDNSSIGWKVTAQVAGKQTHHHRAQFELLL